MNQAQFHRGPDDDGVHIEPGIGLAHRRLSIIDLAGGQQPLSNEDGSVIVTYNGEIYNYQALTDELIAAGHEFRTRSDTEVIVHGWEQWGEECVERFRGMFAFALWDRNQNTLFLARDRIGIKPLYYAFLPNGYLIFGSELKALLAHPDLPRDIEARAVEDYFAYGYIPEPRTVFSHARKLSPAHTLTIRRNATPGVPKEYWDVPFEASAVDSGPDVGRELIGRLREAVRVRLISEVPLGAFLSGGVDSSAVVAMMAELSSKPVKTCSIAFGDARYNEAGYAARVAERYETDHRVDQVDPSDFDLLDRLAGLYDEPFADSSAMPTYRVCEFARRGVTVALSGDGGDESFAGYRRYRWHVYEQRMRSLMPSVLRRPLFDVLGRLYPKADWAPKMFRAKATFESLARDGVDGYFHSVSIFGDPMRRRLFSARFRREIQDYHAHDVLRRHAARAPTGHPLSLVQYLDFKTYLPGDILTKVDRASMAHSLEVRVPILDHELVEWTSGLPPEQQLVAREGKHLFKRALEPYLPHDCLYRPKMGFAVPLADWFRGPLKQRARDALLGPVLADSGIFNRQFLDQIVRQHESGARDHSAAIWTLLMFESFFRQSVTGETSGVPSSRQMAV